MMTTFALDYDDFCQKDTEAKPLTKESILWFVDRYSKAKFGFFLCISGYIGEFEIVDDHRAGKIVVNLTGRLNKCGVISPRFDVPITQIEKWTNNLLPSRQFG